MGGFRKAFWGPACFALVLVSFSWIRIFLTFWRLVFRIFIFVLVFAIAEFLRSFMFGASTMFWIDAGAMAFGKVSAIMVSNCVNITFSVFVLVGYGWGGWFGVFLCFF